MLVSLSRSWAVYLEISVLVYLQVGKLVSLSFCLVYSAFAIPWGLASLGPLRDLDVLCCQTLKDQGHPGAHVLLEAEGSPCNHIITLLVVIMIHLDPTSAKTHPDPTSVQTQHDGHSSVVCNRTKANEPKKPGGMGEPVGG